MGELTVKRSFFGEEGVVVAFPFEEPSPTSAWGAILSDLIELVDRGRGRWCGKSIFRIFDYLVKGESDAPPGEEQRAPANG